MYGKIGDGGLTGGANRAIVMALGVGTRCRKRQLATVKAAISRIDRFAVSLYSLSLPGALRRGVTYDTSSYPGRLSFCSGRRKLEGESGKSSIVRRSTCTAVNSRRNFNSSPDGSSSGVSTPEAGADAANANSENSPIPPVRLRSRSKSTRSTRRSTTRSSRSICSVRNFTAGHTQKTHYARIQEGGRSEHEKNHMAGRRLVSDHRGGIRRRFPDDGPMKEVES